MKTRYYLLLAAMGLLASCSKQMQEPVDMPDASGVKTVLTVGIAPGTRTYMGDASNGTRKVYWSNGDQIAVNGTASEALADLPDNAASATFTFEGTLTSPYNLLYPASIYTDATHVTLPAVQSYTAGGFANNMFPMAGYSTGASTLEMSHLCAILKISILQETTAQAEARNATVDTDNIAAVRFQGRNDEQVSGEFEIDYTAPALTAATGSGTDLEVRVAKSLATSTDTAVEYYLVVPVRSYSNGFDIIVQDANGHVMTKSKTSAWNPEAGKQYDMPAFAFAPTGTELGIEISNAQELIDFATAYNAEEYKALGTQLLATVTDDIVFDATSSAAFNATGGIASVSSDNYFNGVFDGNDHTISGLEATVPLFAAVGGDGHIKDLTLDNSCSFTFTHTNSGEGMFGSIAGYHKGEINNVKVAADVSLASVASITYMTTLGGLVGRATTGTVTNGSEYSGLISTPAGFTSTNKLIIGGLVGRFSNAGSVTGSYFKGAISNAAQVTSSDKNNPYLIIGGIVGHLGGGASVSSTHTTADHAAVESAHSSLSGIIVNKTTVAYYSAVGGIVGELDKGEVSSCNNAATLALSIFRGADGSGRYMKTGGIVGKNNADGTITGCNNNATVQHRSNPRLQALGGIVGYNAGTVSNCTNNAAVNHMTSGQTIAAGRVVSLGGVIGENYADNLVTNVHNTANLEISSMEDGTNSEERMGGVIGYNEGTVTGGTTKDITNSGAVYNSGTYSNQFLGYYVGGIVGRTKAAVKYAKNTGRAYFRWNQTINVSNIHVGGIAGMAEGTSSSIENCENTVDTSVESSLGGTGYSAQVYLYLPGNASYSDSYVGGIVGLSEATDPVKDCTNGGEVRTAAGASTTPVTGIMMGGIIGMMTGSGEVNNGDNSGTVRINFAVAAEGHSGNYLGGIVGYITNTSSVTVTGCDNSGAVYITCGAGLVQDCITSGVVGRMDAPGSITNSHNNGGTIQMAITKNSVGPKDLYTAGVLGYSTNDVSISGCTNSGAISGGNATAVAGTAFYAGGIVAYLKGTSEILNCSNTGSTVTTHAGNTDTIGSTCLTGGIAGFVEGTSDNPITIGGTTGCTVNTTEALSASRGWIGGVAGYAKYAQISKCTLESIVGGGCAARGAGGIVGRAEYCTISACYYNGDTIKANQIQAANGEGGIAGYLDNSTIDGCYCYATKFLNNTSQPFGGIVGVSNSGNTIQNCHYKSAVEGPTSGTAVTATVAGSGTFSGSNNAADL